MAHVLTDTLLEDHLRCRTKSYLHLHGRLGEPTAYSVMSMQLDVRHRANALQWLAAQSKATGDGCSSRSRPLDLTSGHELILDAVGGAVGLETHFHGLNRVPGNSRLGPYHYEPIRVYRRPQPNAFVRLLLAFDALILGDQQGFLPQQGLLVCGPTFRKSTLTFRRISMPLHQF